FITFAQVSIAQIINIPDANFKAKLLQADVDQYIAFTDGGSPAYRAKIDINNNGDIEVPEVLPIKALILNNCGISDLTGIEYFINLENLQPIFNNLTTINVSTLTQLKRLAVSHNQLTTIDVSNQTQLVDIETSFNNFNTLDLSSNPNLDILWCRNNPNLTYINLKNNRDQSFTPTSGSGNRCWYNVPNLVTVCADSSEVVALQQFLTTCGNSSGITVTTNCLLDVENFEMVSYSIYPNPTSGILNIDSKIDLKSVAIYDVQLRLVNQIDHPYKNLTVDLSSFSSGCYFLKILSSEGVMSTKKIVKE
ncbi:MAG: T9SS type A sorting domain-containing protein, partial [Flavobacterium sp.]|nr:T9SS type A sorting domain-containing protein [Flavobacterium sp.]